MLVTVAADRALEGLRGDILSGRYAPGARLGEAELAADLGMSRTPVREALRRLAAEGLVDHEPNRGARVVLHSDADLDTVFVLRARSEGLAARRAAHTASEADLDELDRLAHAVAAAARPERPDLDAVYRHNRAFHDLVLALAGSPTLRGTVDALVHSSVLLRTYQAFDEPAMHRSTEHHLELVAALRARDPDWAESVMHSHLYSARAALLRSRAAAAVRPNQEDTA